MARHDKEFECIVPPSEAQGVYIHPKEEYFNLGSDDPALIEKRTDAMRWEDAALKKFMDKNQLDKWAQDAYQAADREVRRQTDKATANGANGSAINLNGNGSANGHVIQSVELDADEDNIS